ncbi:MAG TPA: F0F1 ATP synthase subunit A [Planctomycetota bacterium]|nr:F0F1 ATP synthase subunit A [Planctomycetota bacterium]
MGVDKFSPDQWVFFEWGTFHLNATIVFTWVVMAVLVGVSWLVTRKLSSTKDMTRGQNVLETVVVFLRAQIRSLSNQDPDPYLPFIGTLFLFIVTASVLSIVPGFAVPTASVTTTVALATCVLVGVPIYGIRNLGFASYLKNYVRPTPLMLPFNIIGEITRTVALAIRLFGNMLSGDKIVAVLSLIAPIGPAVIMNAFGLLVGVIQAYIFALLAMVYIASGMQREDQMRRKIAAKVTAAGTAGPQKERNPS